MINCKWQMKDNTFKADHEGYEVYVRESGLGWIWSIKKDGEVVDDCFAYSPPTGGELGAKVAAQRVLTKLLNSDKNVQASVATTAK